MFSINFKYTFWKIFNWLVFIRLEYKFGWHLGTWAESYWLNSQTAGTETAKKENTSANNMVAENHNKIYDWKNMWRYFSDPYRYVRYRNKVWANG